MKKQNFNFDYGLSSILYGNQAYNYHLNNLQKIYTSSNQQKGSVSRLQSFSPSQLAKIESKKKVATQLFRQGQIRRKAELDRKNQGLLERLKRVNDRPPRFPDIQASKDFGDKMLMNYKEHKVTVSYLATRKKYEDINENNTRLSSRIKALKSSFNMKNLEANYQKNREMAGRLSRYKKDPTSDKYVLYGCLVFEGGRYRPAGEKYYSMTRASSKSSSRSSSKSIRSLSIKSSLRDLQATEKILSGDAKVVLWRDPSSKKSIRSRGSHSQSIVGGRKFTVEYVEKVRLPKTASNGTQLPNHNGSRATKASEKETPRSFQRKHIVRTARDDKLPRIFRPGQPSSSPQRQRSSKIFTKQDPLTRQQRRESVGAEAHLRLNRTVEEHPASREQSVSASQQSSARKRARLERSLH